MTPIVIERDGVALVPLTPSDAAALRAGADAAFAPDPDPRPVPHVPAVSSLGVVDGGGVLLGRANVLLAVLRRVDQRQHLPVHVIKSSGF